MDYRLTSNFSRSFPEPLINNTTNKDLLHDDPATVQLLNLVLELLSFCVEHHTFHAKNYIMNKDIVVRILVLMKSKHKYLALGQFRGRFGWWFVVVESRYYCDTG